VAVAGCGQTEFLSPPLATNWSPFHPDQSAVRFLATCLTALACRTLWDPNQTSMVEHEMQSPPEMIHPHIKRFSHRDWLCQCWQPPTAHSSLRKVQAHNNVMNNIVHTLLQRDTSWTLCTEMSLWSYLLYTAGFFHLRIQWNSCVSPVNHKHTWSHFKSNYKPLPWEQNADTCISNNSGLG